MSFDINKHQHNHVQLKNTDFDLSVWIQPAVEYLEPRVCTALAIESGNARMLIFDITREKAEELISALHAHIETIKQAETELLAMQMKEAT